MLARNFVKFGTPQLNLLAARAGQVFQYRTIGSLVARAVIEQDDQRALHGLHGFYALRQVIHMTLGNAFDAGAGALAVVPKVNQFRNFSHGKS